MNRHEYAPRLRSPSGLIAVDPQGGRRPLSYLRLRQAGGGHFCHPGLTDALGGPRLTGVHSRQSEKCTAIATDSQGRPGATGRACQERCRSSYPVRARPRFGGVPGSRWASVAAAASGRSSQGTRQRRVQPGRGGVQPPTFSWRRSKAAGATAVITGVARHVGYHLI
jgi:hypothetical protein